jgi:hypothetical protein
MKNGVKIGLAVAAGYCLGRHRKLRLAGTLAVAGVAGLRRKSKLLDKGVKALGSPELEKMAGHLRADVLEAGKAAAMAAAGKQITAWSEAIHQRADALRHPEQQVRSAADTATATADTATQAATDVAGKTTETAGKTAETAGKTAETAGKTAGTAAAGVAAKATGPLGGATGKAADEADTSKETAEAEEKESTAEGERGETADEAEDERRTEPGQGSAEAGLRVVG